MKINENNTCASKLYFEFILYFYFETTVIFHLYIYIYIPTQLIILKLITKLKLVTSSIILIFSLSFLQLVIKKKQ